MMRYALAVSFAVVALCLPLRADASGAGPLAAAILPASRSVEIGEPATVFVTIINAGGVTATSVGISIQTAPVGVSLNYQTTDPATNALTRTVNTPVDIGPGQAQTYLIALTSFSPFGPTNVTFNFAGTNTMDDPVPVLTGINTLLLSVSLSQVPDVVALAASVDPGIVDIKGATGTGFFGVATVNVGLSGMITVTVDTNGVTLPISFLVCLQDPRSGQCVNQVASSATTTIAHNATPPFIIFVQATGSVSFDPAANRVFVRFTDANGVVRGATSVAVRTQ